MKHFSISFTLLILLNALFFQTKANAQALESSVKYLQHHLSSVQNKNEYYNLGKNFLNSLQEDYKKDKQNTIEQLRSQLSYESERKVNALLETMELGILSEAEIKSEIQKILLSSQATGAAWDGKAVLEIAGVTLILVGLIYILTSPNTIYEKNDCNFSDPLSYCYQVLPCETNLNQSSFCN